MTSLDSSAEIARPASWRARIVMPVIFTAAIFVSASLLFFVQPLFAKLVLPQIGGAPGVWTTAMLFFQMVLLGGYIYAHVLTKHVPLRLQLPIHLVFWAVALLFLPLSVSPSWAYDPQTSTTWQTLTLFAAGVGVPFAMLSANAPLLQAWYAKSDGPSAQDPYFLYGASNFGSLLALLGFPLIAEPLFGAQAIGWGWAAGFVAFGGFLAASGLLALRSATARPAEATPRPDSTPIPMRDIATWLFLAFVPSTLMLAITTKVSTDLGSFPLIWVIPLALYILSFVVTFTTRPFFSDRTQLHLSLAAVGTLAILMSHQSTGVQAWVAAILFAPCLFIIACAGHRTLYNRRPNATHLTVFYITMSVGGALGGVFNSIVAPAVFSGLHEGPLSVLAAALLLCLGARHVGTRAIGHGILVAAIALAGFSVIRGQIDAAPVQVLASLALIAAFAFGLSRLSAAPVAGLIAVAVFFAADAISVRESYLFKDRSFFGAHRVYDTDGLRVYGNGTTIHGYQYVAETGAKPTPLSYYHPQSPMAQVVTTSEGIDTARIAVVGLGVGSLACYSTPGQSWEYYEIDEMVDRVARNPAMFNFMSHCAPGSQTHLGDARIVLDAQDLTFDIIVLDAYSSDSIPVHLVTREAVELYLRRLSEDGQMVFHISNRYYDLTQPLARIARDLGLHMALRVDTPDMAKTKGAKPSVVATLSPSIGRIAHLLKDNRWQSVQADTQPAWTDDRAHLLSALK